MKWLGRLLGRKPKSRPYTLKDFMRDFPVKPAQQCACGATRFEASPRPGVWVSAIIDGDKQHGRNKCGLLD